jgi:hypothetical protein
LKGKDITKVGDGIVFTLNMLSVLALLYFVLYELTRFRQFPTWIYLNVSGNGFQGDISIEVLPLVAVATVFFVTQIYLNYRLFQKNSPNSNQSQHTAKDAHIGEQDD